MKKLSVIIPVYNERNTLLKVLEKVKNVELKDIEKEVIIVDDFSTDGTRDILRKIKDAQIRIFYHEKNYGKGMAIRTAIKNIKGDIVIIQDADLEYDPNEYYRLIKPILEGKAKVVYGSRRLRKENKRDSGVSYAVGGIFLSWLTSLLYNRRITDEPTCYKVFKADILQNMDLRCKRFEFCPEVTAKTIKRGIRIHEVPISYYPRSKKQGKKISWGDGFEAAWTLIKYKFVD